MPTRDLALRDAAADGPTPPDAATGDAAAAGAAPAPVGGADAQASPLDARAAETDADARRAPDARMVSTDARPTPTDAAVAPAIDALGQPSSDAGQPPTDAAGRACDAAGEVCNGRDDDCDGEIDEGIERCCDGSNAIPCNGCPAGIVVPPGFVCVPGGESSMGAPEDEPGREADEVSHRVRITSPYFIGRAEVTQAEYTLVMGATPSGHQGCADCPVENLSWYLAIAYCNARSVADGLPPCYETAGHMTYTAAHAASASPVRPAGGASPVACTGYRLATEAEWERAARAGTLTPTYGAAVGVLGCEPDQALDAIAWYCGNAGNQSHPVGLKTSNAFGLVDVLGNTWEWCWDVYAPYPADPLAGVDPIGPEPLRADMNNRIVRGGTFTGGARHTRAANRGYHDAATRHVDVGLRLVRTVSPVP